jgi:hypothetical protein
LPDSRHVDYWLGHFLALIIYPCDVDQSSVYWGISIRALSTRRGVWDQETRCDEVVGTSEKKRARRNLALRCSRRFERSGWIKLEYTLLFKTGMRLMSNDHVVQQLDANKLASLRHPPPAPTLTGDNRWLGGETSSSRFPVKRPAQDNALSRID